MRKRRREVIDFDQWRSRRLFGPQRRRGFGGWVLVLGGIALASVAVGALLGDGEMPELVSDAGDRVVHQLPF
jgi:hypothetical protein